MPCTWENASHKLMQRRLMSVVTVDEVTQGRVVVASPVCIRQLQYKHISCIPHCTGLRCSPELHLTSHKLFASVSLYLPAVRRCTAAAWLQLCWSHKNMYQHYISDEIPLLMIPGVLSKVEAEAEDVLTRGRCVSPRTVSWFIAEGQIHWSSHFLPPQGENCDLNYLADIL